MSNELSYPQMLEIMSRHLGVRVDRITHERSPVSLGVDVRVEFDFDQYVAFDVVVPVSDFALQIGRHDGAGGIIEQVVHALSALLTVYRRVGNISELPKVLTSTLGIRRIEDRDQVAGLLAHVGEVDPRAEYMPPRRVYGIALEQLERERYIPYTKDTFVAEPVPPPDEGLAPGWRDALTGKRRG